MFKIWEKVKYTFESAKGPVVFYGTIVSKRYPMWDYRLLWFPQSDWIIHNPNNWQYIEYCTPEELEYNFYL